MELTESILMLIRLILENVYIPLEKNERFRDSSFRKYTKVRCALERELDRDFSRESLCDNAKHVSEQ